MHKPILSVFFLVALALAGCTDDAGDGEGPQSLLDQEPEAPVTFEPIRIHEVVDVLGPVDREWGFEVPEGYGSASVLLRLEGYSGLGQATAINHEIHARHEGPCGSFDQHTESSLGVTSTPPQTFFDGSGRDGDCTMVGSWSLHIAALAGLARVVIDVDVAPPAP